MENGSVLCYGWTHANCLVSKYISIFPLPKPSFQWLAGTWFVCFGVQAGALNFCWRAWHQCCLQRPGFFTVYSGGRQLPDQGEMPMIWDKNEIVLKPCKIELCPFNWWIHGGEPRLLSFNHYEHTNATKRNPLSSVCFRQTFYVLISPVMRVSFWGVCSNHHFFDIPIVLSSLFWGFVVGYFSPVT